MIIKCKHCLAPIVEGYKGSWRHKAAQDAGASDAHAALPLFTADETLSSLRASYAAAAAEASAASADVAVFERKAEQARARYAAAKAQRDELKRAIAEHPES